MLKDEQTVDLIVNQFPENTEIGMNTGAVLSQLMGMIYLNEFDHYIKLNVKKHKLLSVRASLAHARRTSSHSGMVDYLRNW